MKPIFMLAAAAVSISLLLPTVSNAATPDQTIARSEVRYDDLNLSTAAGRAALQRRIDAGIRRVCAEHGTVDLQARLELRECVRHAKQKSDQQVQLALSAQANRARA